VTDGRDAPHDAHRDPSARADGPPPSLDLRGDPAVLVAVALAATAFLAGLLAWDPVTVVDGGAHPAQRYVAYAVGTVAGTAFTWWPLAAVIHLARRRSRRSGDDDRR